MRAEDIGKLAAKAMKREERRRDKGEQNYVRDWDKGTGVYTSGSERRDEIIVGLSWPEGSPVFLPEGYDCGMHKEKGAVVLGVSKDTVASHKKFEEKYGLPFTLLSDPEKEVIQAYDVWKEKKNYGKVSMGVVRTTYLIDENGIIIKAFGKVKAADNPAQMLGELG